MNPAESVAGMLVVAVLERDVVDLPQVVEVLWVVREFEHAHHGRGVVEHAPGDPRLPVLQGSLVLAQALVAVALAHPARIELGDVLGRDLRARREGDDGGQIHRDRDRAERLEAARNDQHQRVTGRHARLHVDAAGEVVMLPVHHHSIEQGAPVRRLDRPTQRRASAQLDGRRHRIERNDGVLQTSRDLCPSAAATTTPPTAVIGRQERMGNAEMSEDETQRDPVADPARSPAFARGHVDSPSGDWAGVLALRRGRVRISTPIRGSSGTEGRGHYCESRRRAELRERSMLEGKGSLPLERGATRERTLPPSLQELKSGRAGPARRLRPCELRRAGMAGTPLHHDHAARADHRRTHGRKEPRAEGVRRGAAPADRITRRTVAFTERQEKAEKALFVGIRWRGVRSERPYLGVADLRRYCSFGAT